MFCCPVPIFLFLKFILDEIAFIPKKCYEEPVLLHCCIPDAIDWQQGRSERRGAINFWLSLAYFQKQFKSFVIVECVVIISWWSFLNLNMAYQIWFITAYFCFSLCLSITVIGMNNSVCFQNISTEVGHNWVTYLLLCIYTLRTCNILCRLTLLFLSFINALQVS